MPIRSLSYSFCVARRDRHSFPTRRSSDLSCYARTGGCRARICAAMHRECSRSDRKSTRLNSSHVAISYAVFCLKIKTQTYLLTAVVLKSCKKLFEEVEQYTVYVNTCLGNC